MAWWSRKKGLSTEQKKSVPKGLWVKCESCSQLLFEGELEENLQVCPKCGFHMRMPTAARMALVLDEDLQEVEGLDGDRDGLAVAQEAPLARVEHERTERVGGKGSRHGQVLVVAA